MGSGGMSDAKKPWEETWVWDGGEPEHPSADGSCIWPESGGSLYVALPDGTAGHWEVDRRIIETDSGAYGPYGAHRALIAAAPDMARVLLAIEWNGPSAWQAGASGSCPSCGAQEGDGKHRDGCALEAALRKAGVR